MGFLDFPWSWVFGGLIIGSGLLALVLWLRSKSVSVKWYEWLIGAIGLLVLLFGIQNFGAAFVEFEPTAAWMFLLVVGLPGLILLAVAYQLVWRRHRAGS